MNLPDLKQLDKLIALCRKRGIKSVKIDNIELTLSEDAPPTRTRGKKANSVKTSDSSSDTPSEDGWDSLSDEEKLFYSASGMPEDVGNI